jgi:hypothetical protein
MRYAAVSSQTKAASLVIYDYRPGLPGDHRLSRIADIFPASAPFTLTTVSIVDRVRHSGKEE